MWRMLFKPCMTLFLRWNKVMQVWNNTMASFHLRNAFKKYIICLCVLNGFNLINWLLGETSDRYCQRIWRGKVKLEESFWGESETQWDALLLGVRQARVHSLMERRGQKILDSISHESIRLNFRDLSILNMFTLLSSKPSVVSIALLITLSSDGFLSSGQCNFP